MGRLGSLLRREEGVALITSILISMIVLILSTTVVQLTLHNQQQSGNDRRRVKAVAAAEAGIDYYYSYLQKFSEPVPVCSATGTLPTSPPATFTVTPTFYTAAGATIACPYAAGTVPAAVLIRSVGRSGNDATRRTMESYAVLTSEPSVAFDNEGAMFAQGSIDFQSNAQIGGDSFSDADLYTNGTISLKSNSIIYGSVLAQGSVLIQSGSEIRKDVWSNVGITLKSNTKIAGNATSSTSSVTGGKVYGNARAGTSITSQVFGTSTPNTPSAAPPARSYPTFVYSSADWAADGYTVRNYSDCASALAGLNSWWGAGSGANVLRVTGGCTLNLGNVSVRGHLAIVTDGPIEFGTNARLTAVGGPWNVHVFGGLNGASGCKITFKSNAGIGANLPALLYVPANCTIESLSNTYLNAGQVIGGFLVFKHTSTFIYQRLAVPGIGIGGFKQDVSYKREVPTS